MKLYERIEAFVRLGDLFRQYKDTNTNNKELQLLRDAALQAKIHNPWFTAENVEYAIASLGEMLQQHNIEKWLQAYKLPQEQENAKVVAVVMAGNIPLVGFHDLLSILITGHCVLAKLSSKDSMLTRAVVQILIELEPRFESCIELTQAQLKKFDAVIATGSDNSSRYFEYYFKRFPHIIRGNRNSVAILRGDESKAELESLADDIFLFFGLGCRSISKLYLPKGYNIMHLFEAFAKYEHVSRHTKYQNNFDYYRAIYLMNKVKHEASGFAILREEPTLNSAIAVVHFEWYKDLKAVHAQLKTQEEQIQCIVGKKDMHPQAYSFGDSQQPALWDYADNVDTIDFLLKLP